MTDDAELLRRYAGNRDEDAFAELVGRHLGLVYHAALRQCGGDVHRAEDVAQAVFTDLARKAEKLARWPVLAGWLYTSTRYAAAQAVRTEARRQAREQEAHAMNELSSQPNISSEPAAEWERLRPVIDDALHALGERDREAVLLRFFEGRAFADVGVKLFLSEDAARMRVERALEKLRAALVRRGITSTTAALGIALANQVGAAAPAGLTASVTGAALSASAGTGATATLFTLISMHKTSVIALAAIAGMLALNIGPQRANAKLTGELSALGQSERELASLRAEHRRLTAELAKRTDTGEFAAELAALQQRASSLRPRAGTAGLLKIGNRSLFVTPETPRKDIIELFQPGGLSSPMRAWQTMLLSADIVEGRQWEWMEATFCFDEKGQARLDAFLAGLPESTRASFRCREGLVAPVFDQWLWKGNRPRGYSPRRDVPVPGDPSRAESYFQITYASGEKREDHFPFKRFDDGWRYGPLTESDAEQLLTMLDPATGLPKQPRP